MYIAYFGVSFPVLSVGGALVCIQTLSLAFAFLLPRTPQISSSHWLPRCHHQRSTTQSRCTDAAAQRAQMSVIILLSEIDVFDVHITYFGVSFPVLCVWWCVVAAEEPTLRSL